MTTLPLKDPFSQSAYLYARDELLALVPCQLSPADNPISGVAQVPDGHDWLAHAVLKLILKRNDRAYQIIPTRLERAAGGPTLLRFDVMT